MPRRTPLYGLPALSPTDRARDIADVDWANALAIEAILANRGQPPLSSDLVGLVSRLNVITEDSGWNNISYRNSWSTGGGSSSAPLQYRKIHNRVVLAGDVIRPTTPTDRVTVGTLPAGFRPTSVLIQPIGLAAWGADVQIDSDGVIGITANVGRPAGTGYPLTGITFLVT